MTNPLLLNPIRAAMTETGEPVGIMHAVKTVNGPIFTVEYSDGKWGTLKWADFSVYSGDCDRFSDLILSVA